ncbi:hypothetical protein D1159_03880 [Pseudoflavonifractor sp. 524-17]|uniref:hypothetical protein n=1 Tax=Pseudoflavonifractor sp. 524-17 TaxID=2304577 RepID=UPI0013795F13|nr:hypothetical protein [Pseudoflavonifractor sp. 524-17]NCE63739.1 hypothetical protein [Pseudoflavonifractor sp. 524-17]
MRLSDFRDKKGIEVVAKLLVPIGNIAADKEMANAQKSSKHMGEFASLLLQRHAQDVMTMLATLNDQDPADYHCTAATVLVDVFTMISDPELMMLFGLQGQTPASSGSASESTEAPKT